MIALALRYAAFAVLATIANLATQRLVIGAIPGAAGFGLAVVAGTAVGLVLKYLCDKRWIFRDHTRGLAHHGRTFGLYTMTGLVTTAIFWGTETAFWLVWQTREMRELGAVIGLAIGYVLKFLLDRHIVFRAPGSVAPR